jgi:putative transposase
LHHNHVDDLLAERGVAVSYETVRRWVNHFGPMIAAQLRKRRPKPHATWHLDEVYLKIEGRMAYLWRAVGAESEVLDVLVQSKRNKHAALKLMRKLLKKYAFVPERLVTDDLRSYGAAARALGLERLHVRYERAGRRPYSAAEAGGAKMMAAQIAEARRIAGVKAEVTLRSVRRLWMRFRPL